MYQVTRLPNGLTVATAEMPHMTSVSLGLWVGVGGRYEPAEVNGVCHFIEHLLFKGTRRRSARQISQDVEGIGGYLNAFTSEETTCYHSRARHDRFEELLDVLADMFLNSKFDPVEIDKERGVIKEELAMYLDQPQHRVQELLNETLWPDQPLGRPLTGTEKTLDGLNRARLVNYQRENYVAGPHGHRRRRAVATSAGGADGFAAGRTLSAGARSEICSRDFETKSAQPALVHQGNRANATGAGHSAYLLAPRPPPIRVAPPKYCAGREHELALVPGRPRRPWPRVFHL